MGKDGMGDEFRSNLVSICRETAKKFDMVRNGSRWHCEVTEVKISRPGVKEYEFYLLDKNSGHEYQATAEIKNDQNAEWNIEQVRGQTA